MSLRPRQSLRVSSHAKQREKAPKNSMALGADWKRLPSYQKPGAAVEIIFNDIGVSRFMGSWFVAIVIKPIDKDKYLVEYRDLREEGGIKPLKKEADFLHIRPPPPSEEDIDSAVGEKIDAFYNDGWWVGVVTEGIKNGTTGIFYRQSGEGMWFGRQSLCLNKEWVNGTWQLPLIGGEIKRLRFCKISSSS